MGRDPCLDRPGDDPMMTGVRGQRGAGVRGQDNGERAGVADSGGQEGQPPLLAKSRRGKTTSLPLHLTHSAGWLSYNWILLNG